MVTGASGRNWMAYGGEVDLPEGFADIDRDLLTDPQTSGGLLVSCSPDSVDAVLTCFAADRFCPRGRGRLDQGRRAPLGSALTTARFRRER